MEHIGRWAALGALVLSAVVVPGNLRLTAREPVERPLVQGLSTLPAVGEPVSATSTSTTTGLPEPVDVAIAPPLEVSGTVAPAPPVRGFSPTSAAPMGQVFAVMIGIDDYPGRRHDLSSAAADASLVDQALAGFGVPDGNRVVLRDGQATRAAVVSAISDLVAQEGPGSTLVLAYAGHVRKLSRHTEAMVLADGGLLTDRELADLLAPVSQRMWLLLATCYAGGFTEALAPGRILTGAAGEHQLAYENRSLGASYLVHYLVREGWLEGAAGPSVQEAFDHASAALAEEHPDRMPVQINPDGTDIRFRPVAPPARTSPPGGDRPPPESPESSTGPTTTTTPERRCLVLFRCKD